MKKIFKNRKTIIFFFLWFASIVLFDLIFFLKKDSQELTSIELLFFLLTIGVGIISFIVFILSLDKFFHQKYPKVKASIFSSLSFIGFLIFGIGLTISPFILFNKPQEIVKSTQASKNTLISSPLKLGSTGEEVKILQSALSTDKSLYPSGIISGYYGGLTRQAVINFQEKYNLSQTGEVDQQTIDKFNEIYGEKTKEYYLALFPTPVIYKNIVLDNKNQNTEIDEWGVAKQISDKTWIIKVGFDQKMGNAQEIFEALNNYRERHGRNRLIWDDNLAQFALERAKYYTKNGFLDEHKGFNEYVNSESNLRRLGFWLVGENASFGYKLEGVHLIEWVFAGDKPHNDNQLNQNWTHVGIGVDNYQVDIVFGANKI